MTTLERAPLLDGLNRRGMALIVLLCFINAVRRRWGASIVDAYALFEWVLNILQLTVYGLTVALPVALAVVITYNRTPPQPALRYPALALAALVSSFVGVWIAMTWEAHGSFEITFNTSRAVAISSGFVRYGSLCVLFAVVFAYLREADEHAARADRAEREREAFVDRMEQARLKMLQAQIEPHFLFNTLANVRRLYQTSPADGATMFDHLMRYFAVALPHMRSVDSRLGPEADLAVSYLEIQRIRMGSRLAFDVRIPVELRDARLPPMMLLTLVENAIKHGLAPLPEGGSVRVGAAVVADELQVRVADTGRGFTSSSGGGTGLANIRARLQGMYSAAGRLTLAANVPRGVTATIAVPLAQALPKQAAA
jgi:sensor histidine kinase YesM